MIIRQTVAYVSRSHGAYLIQLAGDIAQDRPDSDLWDCASSLVVAKRLAREGAEQIGYIKPFHWKKEGNLLMLEAGYQEEEEWSRGAFE